MVSTVLSDAELTIAAQSGDSAALGNLLARHRAGMLAVALSVTGHGPDADDAFQDAALTALRRIGDVRDPAAAGSWLRTVTRNACLARLRGNRTMSLVDEDALPSRWATPEQVVDRHAMRDWIWRAMEDLSPTLRLMVMLRYFSGVTSYEQIAALCEVPIGTVRSRLNQAKAKMSEALLAVDGCAYEDVHALTALRRREGVETMEAVSRGDFTGPVADRWSPELAMVNGAGQSGGLARLVTAVEREARAGVAQRLTHVVASRDITIWEAEIINPPHDSEHCPPSVVWLATAEKGRIQRLRLFHPRTAAVAA